MDNSWTTYRADRIEVRRWFFVCSALFASLSLIFMFIELAAGIFLFVMLASLLAFLTSLLLRAQIRFNDESIEYRFLRSTSHDWEEVESWSLVLGYGKALLYLRFTDGRVIGSSQWLVSKSELEELVPVISEKLGPPEEFNESQLLLPFKLL